MEVLTDPHPERLRWLRERDEFFWLDLTAPTEEQLRGAADALGLHPLALEDTLEFGQPPKLDPYEDHILLVFYTARTVGDDEAFEPVEVHVFIHGGFIVTVHHRDISLLKRVADLCSAADHSDEERTVYRILDALAEGYEPVIAAVDRRVDEIEGEVLTHPRRDHLARIYRLKQDVAGLLRRVSAQRDTFAVDRILGVPGFRRGDRPYLRDVLDHISEAATNLHRLNGDLVALSDTFFNSSTHRLTRVATLLSVVAAVFFVATFVTSFFGQNFKWLVDNLESRADFLLWGVGGLILSVVLTIGYFVVRRREFFL